MTNPTNETQYPLITHIRERTRDDTDLSDIIGRRMINSRTYAEENYPYTTFWIDNLLDAEGLIYQSTLFMHTWDNADDKLNVLKIRGHLIRLFDRYKVSLDGIVAARFFLSDNGGVQEDDLDIWHNLMQFNLYYDRKVELEQIYDLEVS